MREEVVRTVSTLDMFFEGKVKVTKRVCFVLSSGILL